MSFVVELCDAAATMSAGAVLARALRGGMVIAVAGDLGAGKTTLVRGLLRGLGWSGPVKSPSYALVEHYPFSSLYFYHFDFYRLSNSDEWETAGLSECFRDDSVCAVEWPERVAGLLPPADLELTLTPKGDGRLLAVRASSEAGSACARELAAAFGAT
jgi:tRNA threonylcarbamoyladenosine biosynthesis protein TsaE